MFLIKCTEKICTQASYSQILCAVYCSSKVLFIFLGYFLTCFKQNYFRISLRIEVTVQSSA